MTKANLSILLFLFLVIPAASFAGWGSEFPCNTLGGAAAEYFQGNPDVGMKSDGDFVVIWWSKEIDGVGDIFARRFNDNGDGTVTPLDNPEFQVNSSTTDTNHAQSFPAVAVNASGEFVVVWQSQAGTPTSPNWNIYARKYSWDLTYDSGEISVATTTDNEEKPSVAIDAAGNFIVTWGDNEGTVAVPDFDVIYRVFDTSLTGGSPFHANVYTTDSQRNPSISLDMFGRFVIAWESWNQDGDAWGIYERRFLVDWVNLNASAYDGSDVLVNADFTTSNQLEPDVAKNWIYGEIVIAWHSNANHDGDGSGIFAQRINVDGTFAGTNFQVNQYVTSNQRDPEVEIDPLNNGRFVITWDSSGQDGSDYTVIARRFYGNGSPIENEFIVNQTFFNNQQYPAIAMISYCHFIIVWETYQNYENYTEYDSWDVYGRMMTCDDDNAIRLESFSAKSIRNSVVISWKTGTEIDTLGYYIIRSDNVDKRYTVVNNEIIDSKGSIYSGSSYSFVDSKVRQGSVYYYWLVDVDVNGQYTIHGPARVLTNIWGINTIK